MMKTDARMGERRFVAVRTRPSPSPGEKIYRICCGNGGHAAERGVGDGHHTSDGRGFVFLAVVLDWFSRRVLSWGLSITMEAAFCVETLEEALARTAARHFNTDQGS